MKQLTNNTASLLKSPCGGFRGLYTAPCIEIITLDNEISLALQSTPPDGPDEGYNNFDQPEKFNANIFNA